jgi:hypothetical protein
VPEPPGHRARDTTDSQSAGTLLAAAGSTSPATKEALLHALHRIGPSTDGLFFYRGHAVHDSDPAWSTLPLAEHEHVQSGELFGQCDDGTPFLPMPTPVILSCCSSSTASALGCQGIGLAAGLIQSGADQVIATSVDILDASFTEVFEDLLVEGMLDRQQGDHADLLRRLQLRTLKEWKVYSLRGATSDGDDIRDPRPPHLGLVPVVLNNPHPPAKAEYRVIPVVTSSELADLLVEEGLAIRPETRGTVAEILVGVTAASSVKGRLSGMPSRGANTAFVCT